MVLFNNIPNKRMCLTSKVNLTKRFTEKYKHMRLIIRFYGTVRTFKHCSVCISIIQYVQQILLQANEEWRVIINYIDDHPDLIINKEELQKPRPLQRFDANELKVLNAELKFLYTAITRTRCNLWIYDSNPVKRAPMFYYFQKRGLVRVLSAPGEGLSNDKLPETMEQIFANKPSSPEEWIQKGNFFKENKNWEKAIFCYANAGMDELVLETKAYSNMWMANTMHGKYNYLKAALNFLRAFDTHPYKKRIERAANCLFKASKYDLAALLFIKLNKVRIVSYGIEHI